MSDEKTIGSEYDLTTEEFNRSLTRAEIALFSNCKTREKPQSFFVVAQPGAGKTGLKTSIVRNSQDSSSFIEFDSDVVGIYHEHYLKIMRDYPGRSFKVLERFVQPAIDDYLRLKAIKLRANIVQEGTMSNTDIYLKILEFYKHGGSARIGDLDENGLREYVDVQGNYHVEIAALAVDRFESLLSSYEREQLYRDQGLPARVVLPEYHDNSYKKMLDTIDEIEKRRLADRISVYKRGYIEDNPELLWVSGDRRFKTARDSITHFRDKEREELMENPEQYRERIQSLLLKAENPEQKSRIEKLSKEFEIEVSRYKERDAK